MKISEIITKLENAKRQYGDLPVSTFDGFVSRVDLSPARDGVSSPLEDGQQNEICMELVTSFPVWD